MKKDQADYRDLKRTPQLQAVSDKRVPLPDDLQSPSSDDADSDQTKLPTPVRDLFHLGYEFPPLPQGGAGLLNPQGGLSPNYNSLKCTPVYGYNPNRQAPAAVLASLHVGDVIFFDGSGASSQGHAEMYCGRDASGKPLFASDAHQGSNFFANEDFTHGGYKIYRDTDPNFNASRAVARIEADTEGRGYGGECASEVRQSVEYGAGHSLGDRPDTAAGYNNSDTLARNGFVVVGSGGPDGFHANPALAPAKTARTQAPHA